MPGRLAAIGLITADVARAAAFYRALGLDVPEPPSPEGHFEVTLADGLRLMWDNEALIRQIDPAWTPPAGGHRVVVAFECASPADVDETYERALAADPDVHVVHNTTPNHLHVPVILAALAHRKHVISDKPLAMSGDDAQRLCEAATDAGVVHAVTFNYRGNPLVQQAREMIAGGDLGEIGFDRIGDGGRGVREQKLEIVRAEIVHLVRGVGDEGIEFVECGHGVSLLENAIGE